MWPSLPLSSTSFSLPLPWAFMLTFCCAVSVLSSILYLRSHHVISPLVGRKLIHSLMGPCYTLFWIVFPPLSSSPNSHYFCAAVPFILTMPFLLVGLNIISFPSLTSTVSRSGHFSELLFGPLIYGILQVFGTLAYWTESPIGVLSIIILATGDGAADIIGRRFGKGNSLFWNPKKSFFGSLGFFVFGVIGCVGIMTFYQTVGIFPQVNIYKILVNVSLCCFVESLPIDNYDNLTIFASSMMVGYWIY